QGRGGAAAERQGAGGRWRHDRPGRQRGEAQAEGPAGHGSRECPERRRACHGGRQWQRQPRPRNQDQREHHEVTLFSPGSGVTSARVSVPGLNEIPGVSRMRCLLVAALAALVPLAARAQEEKKGPPPIKVPELKRTDAVSYEKEVEPIFYKRCVTCHSGSVKEARFDIASYEGLIKGGKRGTSITPGKSESSLLYKLVTRQQKPYMPPKGEDPITPEEIAVVKLWIDQGAKAPTGTRERAKIVIGVPPANVHPVRAVAVSPDGKVIAGA